MYIGKTLLDTIQCTKREDTVNSPKAVTAEITMYLLTEIVDQAAWRREKAKAPSFLGKAGRARRGHAG